MTAVAGRARWALAALLASACSGPQQPRGGEEPRASDAAPAADAPPVDAGPPASPAVPRRDDGVVRLEGAPEVPPALTLRLARYLDTRGARLADLGDDGRRALVTTRLADTEQVHWLAAPMGARRQLTFGDEPAVAVAFAPAARAVVYRSDVGGDERDQFFRLDLDDGRTTRLTDGRSRNTDLLWSRDGRRIVYASNARNGVDFDLWVGDGVDPASARLLCQGRGSWRPLDWSRDGKRLLVGERISINRQRVHLVDAATGAVTSLTPDLPQAAFAQAIFGASGRVVYLTGDHQGEFQELYELDLATAAFRPLSRGIPWDVEAIALSADGATLAFVTDEDGYSALRLLDTRRRRLRRVSGLPAGVIEGLRFARRADVLGFSLAGPTDSGDVYTYDLRRGALTQWTDSEMGGLARSSLIEPELIRYRTFDGAEIPAFYYRPRGAGPFPVLITVHGGPESQARPRFSPLVQFLAVEQGTAVVAPNVRGSSGYGKTYLTLDDGVRREDAVADLGALLDWIAGRPELAADRVAVHGGSYGGYLALAALVHFGPRLAAGIDVVGISRFVTFLEQTSEYRRDLRRVEYGDERDPTLRAFLERISPLHNAARIRSPLFVAQGANDPRVPVGEAEQIVAAVRAAGQPVWYLLARNEGHGFDRKTNRDLFLSLAALFLDTHIGAGGDAAR